MKKYILILFVGLAVACSSSRHGTGASGTGGAGSGSGGSGTGSTGSGSASTAQDGNSFETAIVIREKSETAGVRAEYAWCADHYPGYKTQMQALSNKNGIPYDILTIALADGTVKKVYFDISNFFGKF